LNNYYNSFDKGSYVIVTNKRNNEFWKIEMKGVMGFIPVNYLSKVELSPQETVIFLFIFSFFSLNNYITI